MSTVSTEAANFSWLLDNFVKSVPDVRHTLVVSADGLLMAMSDELDRTSGDQLAAIVQGAGGYIDSTQVGHHRGAVSSAKYRSSPPTAHRSLIAPTTRPPLAVPRFPPPRIWLLKARASRVMESISMTT